MIYYEDSLLFNLFPFLDIFEVERHSGISPEDL